MISIILKYGLTKRLETEVRDGATVGEVLSNPNHRAVLGFPESCNAVVDGVTLQNDDVLSDGDEVIIEKQAAKKAA